MPTFFMNIRYCVICCSGGTAQNAWKNTLATSVNTASASAAQRVFQPSRSATPARISTAIALDQGEAAEVLLFDLP